MNYREHEPPHFHARYQDYEISVEIRSGVIEGKMPKRALKLLIEWAEQHKDELNDNWHRVQEKQPLSPILPLD